MCVGVGLGLDARVGDGLLVGRGGVVEGVGLVPVPVADAVTDVSAGAVVGAVVGAPEDEQPAISAATSVSPDSPTSFGDRPSREVRTAPGYGPVGVRLRT